MGGEPSLPAGADPRRSDEQYLAAVFELEEEMVDPIQARVAERLGVSAAAVSEAVPRLVQRGYLADGNERSLCLTDAGRQVALTVVRRHRLAERLLVDILGLAWEKVHREAARWEHVISEDVEARLVDVLGDPATCPHGNPIPGSGRGGEPGPAVPLAGSAPGPVTVARISERLESDDAVLILLARARLTPGCGATIVAVSADSVTVRTPAGEQAIPSAVAAQVWVAPASAPPAGSAHAP